jgi:cation-transporting P-type ATPase C
MVSAPKYFFPLLRFFGSIVSGESDTMVLDKTGTMTEGRPLVVHVAAFNDKFPRQRVLELAAAAAETSTHPMAVAIVNNMQREGWRIPAHSNTEVHTARGVSTVVGKTPVRVGSRLYMKECGIVLENADDDVQKMATRGQGINLPVSTAADPASLSLEDLVREKEKLEDLIAEREIETNPSAVTRDGFQDRWITIILNFRS